DPPFTTDLLLYRTPAGDSATAVFHLAPSAQASAVTLRDGVDHIRITDYPGRIDRGSLIGAEGGRVSNEMVSIDIPTGATLDPIHAALVPITDFSAFGSIAGFHIAGGFTLSLTRTDSSVSTLLKPARATLTVPATTQQVIVAEVLRDTPFGVVLRLAATTQRSTSIASSSVAVFTTRAIDPAVLPLDGIVRDSSYLILTADNPIAFAFGQVRLGSGGATLSNTLVTTAGLGIADLTRIGGVFVVPVLAKPAAPFSLRARSLATGDGAPSVSATAPDADAIVPFGDLILAPQPPHLLSITPANGAILDPGAAFLLQATFDMPIDAASVADAVVVNNLSGTADAVGSIVTFHPSEALQPAAQYSVTVLPQLRGSNGTPFGRAVVTQFSTRNLPAANTSIRPELIRITIPDATGASVIGGRAGALPAGSQAVAVRRARAFNTQYQGTAASDGSFSFAAGGGTDSISVSDAVDLQVIDGISHAMIAVIPLTPFTTKDGNGFLTPPNSDVRFVTSQGVAVNVPAGAFETPTLITVSASTAAAFADMPSFANQLAYTASVNVQFDGTAKKRIDIDLPIPPNTDTSKPLFLGYLGQSIRGPRVMIVDTLRLESGRLTTMLPSGVSSSSLKPASTSNIRPSSVFSDNASGKAALLGAITGGTYGAVSFAKAVSWAVFDGLSAHIDLFWDSMPSLYASSLYLAEGRGRVLVPVAADTRFQVVGVDIRRLPAIRSPQWLCHRRSTINSVRIPSSHRLHALKSSTCLV
ncbi:MAG: hypothetical protein DMF58_20295, partial [Acidobacteria bacterium]